MNFLLDTHVILWWLTEPKQLSKKAQQIIQSNEHEVTVSVVSVWELAIKHRLKRVIIPHHFMKVLEEERITLLSIQAEHTLATIDLPDIHQDLFDRLLVAQAKCQSMTLITRDPKVVEYPIITLLA